jgi:ParB family chromosome partitioning protein
MIPAFVIEASDQEAYIMSLVENIARRNPHPTEIFEALRTLQKRGYSATQIAKKTAIEENFIRGLLQLLNKGEHRLIAAVEAGRFPIRVAI